MEKERGRSPWRDGSYKNVDGGTDLITIAGEKLTFSSFDEAKLKFGSFGEADPKIVEMTGERNYNVELIFDFVGREMADYGVLMENGTKLVLKGISGIRTRVWVTPEEAESIANDGDPIEAPTSHYKVEPERQGKLIWITGPPGLGKSTSAQLLSREHGYVYYEGDCFFGLRNPYIPPGVENPTMAQRMQRKLVGEGEAERRKTARKILATYRAMMKGEAWDRETLEEGMREMFRDIGRERERLGGDWAVAGVILTSRMRQIARFSSTLQNTRLLICQKHFNSRMELGEDLEIINLEMTVEEQEERVRARHDGNQHAVDLMRVKYQRNSSSPTDFNQWGNIRLACGSILLNLLRRSMTSSSQWRSTRRRQRGSE